MLVGMQLKTSAGRIVDVGVEEILAAAGRICATRRKTHGGPPLHAFHCRWCRTEVRGRAAFEAHQRECDQRPADFAPIGPDDLIPWQP
jgi:hypothetical protein